MLGEVQIAPRFLRTACREGNRMAVKSTCEDCGFTMIGSIPQLAEKEWQHRRECDSYQKPKAVSA